MNHPPLPIIPPHADFSPAANRNREPIFESILPWLDQIAQVSSRSDVSLLEIASGTGQHAAYFASRYPTLTIQPSDLVEDNADSVNAWAESLNVNDQVASLLALDVRMSAQWPKRHFDVIFCANMIHISPWSATEALFKESPLHLNQHGLIITYGPYRFETPLAPSNLAFDESLRSRNREWGIRSIEELDRLAFTFGLERIETIACPAHNHILIFRRLS